MLDQPVLSTLDMKKLERVTKDQRRHFKAKRFDTLFDKDNFVNDEKNWKKICKQIEQSKS